MKGQYELFIVAWMLFGILISPLHSHEQGGERRQVLLWIYEQ